MIFAISIASISFQSIPLHISSYLLGRSLPSFGQQSADGNIHLYNIPADGRVVRVALVKESMFPQAFAIFTNIQLMTSFPLSDKDYDEILLKDNVCNGELWFIFQNKKPRIWRTLPNGCLDAFFAGDSLLESIIFRIQEDCELSGTQKLLAIVYDLSESQKIISMADSIKIHDTFENKSLTSKRILQETLSPFTRAVWSETIAATPFNLFWKYYETDDLIKARAVLNRLRKIAPFEAQTWFAEGYIAFYNDKNTNAAIEFQKRAIALDSTNFEYENYLKFYTAWSKTQNNRDNPDGWSELGEVCIYWGEVSRAIEYFDRAVALDTSHVKSWLGLASSYSVLGKTDSTITYLRKALYNDHLNIDAYWRLVPLLHDSLALYHEAYKLNLEFFNAFPNEQWIQNNLILSQILTGRYKEAKNMIEKSRSQIDSDAPHITTLSFFEFICEVAVEKEKTVARPLKSLIVSIQNEDSVSTFRQYLWTIDRFVQRSPDFVKPRQKIQRVINALSQEDRESMVNQLQIVMSEE